MKKIVSPAATAAAPGSTSGSTLTPFEFSRLYAKGWMAGRNGTLDLDDKNFDAATAALNPGKTDVERSRWLQGFKEGLQGGTN